MPSNRQKEYLDAIREYWLMNTEPPTESWLAAYMGVATVSANTMCQRLKREGQLKQSYRLIPANLRVSFD
jgi:Mn-dependent DtxR family transcriptional regulator